jgi:hypothetical protein
MHKKSSTVQFSEKNETTMPSHHKRITALTLGAILLAGTMSFAAASPASAVTCGLTNNTSQGPIYYTNCNTIWRELVSLTLRVRDGSGEWTERIDRCVPPTRTVYMTSVIPGKRELMFYTIDHGSGSSCN